VSCLSFCYLSSIS